MTRLPPEYLGHPVLIRLGSSLGTGFLLSAGTNNFVVTAKHVLVDPQHMKGNLRAETGEVIAYSENPKDKDRYEFSVDFKALQGAGDVRASAQDAIVVRLGTVTAGDDKGYQVFTARPGVVVRSKAESPAMFLPISMCHRLDEVRIGNECWILGYPSSIGIRAIPQVDYERPLVKRGSIAGKNSAQGTLIVDAAVFPGNSGGPVIELDQETFLNTKAFLVGIVSQFVPLGPNVVGNSSVVNSGYSVVVAMDPIIDLVESFVE